MDEAAGSTTMTEQDRQISEIFAEQRARLRNFIRRRVPDPSDAEDIVQEVFYELVEANRLLMPIEHVTGWLFRVARNRITDLFRKKRPETFADAAVEDEEGELRQIEDLLPSPDAGPEALYVRSVLLDELRAALDELPDEQREVFVAHELEGRSFKELSEETGVNVNTLLSRKRYAVLQLRKRLQSIHNELTKKGGPRYEKEMVFSGPADPAGNRGVHRDRRRSGDAVVELAAAGGVRVPADYLLAGDRAAGSVPDSVRRPWRPRLAWPQSEADVRTLGEDDARRAREAPPGYALALRRLWRAERRNR